MAKKLKPPNKTDRRDQKLLALWAADCAEHVLPLFERERPHDDRPRKAIEAGRAWVRDEIKCGAARAAALASHAAARDVDEGPARAVARAAGHAAATAHMASHARGAAAYAIKAVTIAAAASAFDAERDWQHRRIPKSLRGAIDDLPGNKILRMSSVIEYVSLVDTYFKSRIGS